MHYLTKENAQKITDRIMKIVPYNINIMKLKILDNNKLFSVLN